MFQSKEPAVKEITDSHQTKQKRILNIFPFYIEIKQTISFAPMSEIVIGTQRSNSFDDIHGKIDLRFETFITERVLKTMRKLEKITWSGSG